MEITRQTLAIGDQRRPVDHLTYTILCSSNARLRDF